MLLQVNKQFNLISRSDISQVRDHHVGHCLAYALRSFPAGSTVVDWGSGGGLPAIPISILWPEVTVIAIDSNAKKTRSIDLFSRRLGLKNCSTWHGRAENWSGQADYSVSRATAPLRDLWSWHDRATDSQSQSSENAPDNCWERGLVCLKGGDLRLEIADLLSGFQECDVQTISLNKHISDSYFDTKLLVHVTQKPNI